jgi:hypothetical protein
MMDVQTFTDKRLYLNSRQELISQKTDVTQSPTSMPQRTHPKPAKPTVWKILAPTTARQSQAHRKIQNLH